MRREGETALAREGEVQVGPDPEVEVDAWEVEEEEEQADTLRAGPRLLLDLLSCSARHGDRTSAGVDRAVKRLA